MNITDQAKAFLQEVMQENGAENIKVIFSGMG
ncbi:hypothetical protein HNQ41_002200 [Texcoconibacillus texcoconensis]|uniref:Uncharacterized protein n=3 Tax=Texcoconibacillus texcoconensis TaxID=1095777 RepID=A0A840QRN4_9BACI|nr:hypothetical protein [Texcoconibacillus texcoconensis]